MVDQSRGYFFTGDDFGAGHTAHYYAVRYARLRKFVGTARKRLARCAHER